MCATNSFLKSLGVEIYASGHRWWPDEAKAQAVADTLIVTAKMNDIDPQAWLADVLARLPDMPVSRMHELLPWNWKSGSLAEAA